MYEVLTGHYHSLETYPHTLCRVAVLPVMYLLALKIDMAYPHKYEQIQSFLLQNRHNTEEPVLLNSGHLYRQRKHILHQGTTVH